MTAIIPAQTTVASEISMEEKLFLSNAYEGVLLEVKLGEFAQLHGQAEEIKINAELMVNSHGKDVDEVTELAVKKNIVLPESLGSKLQKKYDALVKFKGKSFDKKYIRCMIKDHEKDLRIFKKEINDGKDPEIKAWAGSKLPVLQLHLDMWKGAYKAAKEKTAAKGVS